MLHSGTTEEKGNGAWETPPAIFEKIQRDFGPFDIDLTANASNHLCRFWFGPGSASPDALEVDWSEHGKTGYSNPPYGLFVPLILAKAAREQANGFQSVFLLPMRATRAFHCITLPKASALLFCNKRIVFYENGKPRLNKRTGKPDCAPFDSIIVVFDSSRRGNAIRVDSWSVPKHI